jgi:hypothetical protein
MANAERGSPTPAVMTIGGKRRSDLSQTGHYLIESGKSQCEVFATRISYSNARRWAGGSKPELERKAFDHTRRDATTGTA